ncbi:MAG: lysylphosphatidylglycerol synthase transmembrane domain-containing protein [Bacteroidota bacterium]
MSPPAAFSGRSLLRLGGSLLLAGGFLYLAFRTVDLDMMWESLRGVRYGWLFLLFVSLMASHLVRAHRWGVMLGPVKRGIGLRNLFAGVLVGYMVNNVLPRAGELVRPYALARLESIPAGAAFGSIVFERLIDMLTFLLLVLLVPFLYAGPLQSAFPWLETTGMYAAVLTLGVFLALVVMMLRRGWTDRFLALIRRVLPPGPAERICRLTHSFLDGFMMLRDPGRIALFLAQSAAVWGLYALNLYIGFRAFGLGERLDGSASLVVLAISSIGVALPTPGGLGTYHLFVSQTLTQLYGVPAPVALSYGTAVHAVGYVGVTLWGLYFFFRDHIRVAEALRTGGGAS